MCVHCDSVWLCIPNSCPVFSESAATLTRINRLMKMNELTFLPHNTLCEFTQTLSKLCRIWPLILCKLGTGIFKYIHIYWCRQIFVCHSNTHTLVMLNWLCHTNQEQNRHQVRKLFQWKCVRIIRSVTKYQYNIFFIPLLVHQSYFFDMCMTCMNNYLYTPLIISLCNFFLISTLLSTPGTI